jgi:hypothetical protein
VASTLGVANFLAVGYEFGHTDVLLKGAFTLARFCRRFRTKLVSLEMKKIFF